MSRDWKGTFRSWGQAPSHTERDKCENAERAIRKAIASSSSLVVRSISIFAQGSYNVRQDSDVDICVPCRDVFYYDLPAGVFREAYGTTPATLSTRSSKSEVDAALSQYWMGRLSQSELVLSARSPALAHSFDDSIRLTAAAEGSA